MRVLENLEPQRVFYYFEEIANIPHGSRDTKRISDYLAEFGKAHNLETIQDSLNNVILIKEASNGYENADPIIIQGHMDMVCEKESDSTINFETDPLELYVDGDFVKANKTTLGGDDGIAVAYALALLESEEIKHPRLEVVITVDEEIGMLGAEDIDLSMLKGKKMLNIDSDVEGEFLTGCAGGMGFVSKLPVKREELEGICLEIKVAGLEGGHSGAEIDKEHGNANIIMGRVFAALREEIMFSLVSFEGGTKDNAITRESIATIVVNPDATDDVKRICDALTTVLKNEYSVSDPGVYVSVKQLENGSFKALDFSSVSKIIYYLRMVPNGVQHMSMAISGLVETSLNLGILKLEEDHLYMVTSIRSSVGTRKEELKDKLILLNEMLGAEVEIEGDYPAWEYKLISPLRDEIAKAYKASYGEEPKFCAIHAGLECGILSEKIKDLDCVSFGPNNYDIHTPKERLSISSTKRVWDFLVKFLEDAK